VQPASQSARSGGSGDADEQAVATKSPAESHFTPAPRLRITPLTLY
jgi:hypothetical protein